MKSLDEAAEKIRQGASSCFRRRNQDKRRETPTVQAWRVQPRGKVRDTGRASHDQQQFQYSAKGIAAHRRADISIMVDKPIPTTSVDGKADEMRLMEAVGMLFQNTTLIRDNRYGGCQTRSETQVGRTFVAVQDQCMNPHSFVGVIPARYASQRLPAKPLLDLLGKTMVQRVYEQAKKARRLNRVVVATDDERIAGAVRAFGGDVVITPPEIKSGSDRVAAVAARNDGDIFLNIQGDEPLIAPQMIDQAAEILIDDPGALVGTLAKRIESLEELLNPGIVKVVVDKNSCALYFPDRSFHSCGMSAIPRFGSRNRTFYKHIGLYVFRRDLLLGFAKMPESSLEQSEKLEQLRILENGYKIKVGFTEHDSIADRYAGGCRSCDRNTEESTQPQSMTFSGRPQWQRLIRNLCL